MQTEPATTTRTVTVVDWYEGPLHMRRREYVAEGIPTSEVRWNAKTESFEFDTYYQVEES